MEFHEDIAVEYDGNPDAPGKRFHRLLAALSDGLISFRDDAPADQWINDDLLATLGYDPSEARTKRPRWQAFAVAEDAIAVEAELSRLRARKSGDFEKIARFRHADGGLRWLALRGLHVKGPDGRRVLITVTDVSSFVNAAEAKDASWRRSHDRLAAVMNTASSGIIGVDSDGQIVTINPPARRLIGGVGKLTPFSWPSEAQFYALRDLHPLFGTERPIERILAGQELKNETLLLEVIGSDQAPRYVRISSSNAGTTRSGLMAVIVIDDVTELEKGRLTLERRARLDALGQLTGGISHDFNNLLATIHHALTLALAEPQSKKARELLVMAETTIFKGRDLTQRLQSFAKRQGGSRDERSTGAVLAELKAMVRPLIDPRIRIVTDDVAGATVRCDIAQLENALLNLILNARDAILRKGPSGEIRISVRVLTSTESRQVSHLQMPGPDATDQPGLFVEISVSDDGAGMSETVRARAVDPFFTTKPNDTGTGLGLAMVYGFVEHEGGQFSLDSEEGTGTTVRLILPGGARSVRAPAQVSEAPIAISAKKTILVLEDEALILGLLSDTLRDAGYEVIEFGSADEANRAIDAGLEFDLLLFDVAMQGRMDGEDLAARVKALDPLKPVVMLSGYAGDRARAGDSAADFILPKPCETPTLFRTLAKAFSSVGGDGRG